MHACTHARMHASTCGQKRLSSDIHDERTESGATTRCGPGTPRSNLRCVTDGEVTCAAHVRSSRAQLTLRCASSAMVCNVLPSPISSARMALVPFACMCASQRSPVSSAAAVTEAGKQGSLAWAQRAGRAAHTRVEAACGRAASVVRARAQVTCAGHVTARGVR